MLRVWKSTASTSSWSARRCKSRAQVAHQQASRLVKQLRRRLRGQPLRPWCYRAFSSLVSLGKFRFGRVRPGTG